MFNNFNNNKNSLCPSIATDLKKNISVGKQTKSKQNLAPRPYCLLLCIFLLAHVRTVVSKFKLVAEKKLLLGNTLAVEKLVKTETCRSQNLRGKTKSFIDSHSLLGRSKLDFQIQFAFLLFLNQKLGFIPLLLLNCRGKKTRWKWTVRHWKTKKT